MKTIQHKGVKYYRVQPIYREGDTCFGCVFDLRQDDTRCPEYNKGSIDQRPKCIPEEWKGKQPWERMDDIFIEATPEALAQYVEQRLT